MAFWNRRPRTCTNAPAHWPSVEFEQFDEPGLNLLGLAARLAELHDPPRSSLAFRREFVYDDGILSAPLVVEEGGRQTAVFLYSKRDQDAAGHFSGVKTLLRTRERCSAVYYGPAELGAARPASVLQPLDTSSFSKMEDPPPDADFALWWATPEAPSLRASNERAFLDRWFEAIDGYGFLVFTSFVRALGMTEDREGLFGLPAQPVLVPVEGPGETRMLLHASSRDGLFLAFDESTPVRRRRTMLRLLADFAHDARRAVEAKKVPPNPEEKGVAVARWRDVRDAALARETEGAAGVKVHAVTARGGQPSRGPSATTNAERAAQPAAPGRPELDFGMDLVDRAMARLQEKGAAGSTDETLGQPNFFPVIAARVGGDVFERHFPFEDAETVKEAARRALDEWPQAEVVAVMVDGAIRENGRRVDIFDVTVENALDGRAAALIQRYGVVDGTAVTIGNPTAMPAHGTLQRSTAGDHPAPPDAALVELARRALDEIVAGATVLDPSGLPGDGGDDDELETLFSPSALVGRPGDDRPTTIRFMLQGPITAGLSCAQSLHERPGDWVAFHVDDLHFRNGTPERRIRLCVQRRRDAGAAIFDQRYAPPRRGRPFTRVGDLEFKRWAGPLLPPR